MSKEGLSLLTKRANYQSLYKLNINSLDKSKEELLYKNINKIKYKNLLEKSVQPENIIKLPMVRGEDQNEDLINSNNNLFLTQSNLKTSNISTSRSLSTSRLSANASKLTSKTSTSQQDAVSTPLEKTSTNVYFWYFRENASTQSFLKPSFKLPLLNKENKNLVDSSKEFTNESKLSNYANIDSTPKRVNSVRKSLTKSSFELSSSDQVTTDDDEHPSSPKIELKPKTKKQIQKKKAPIKRKVILTSAQLKDFPISEKFKKEAKNMVFIPQFNSFYPRNSIHYLGSVLN